MTILYVVLGLVAVLLLAAAVLPKAMNIEHSIVINQPLDKVFDYLKYVRNADNFSVWNMADPNSSRTDQGEDGTVGYVYTWDSKVKNVGAGAQEIKAIVPGKSIEYELRFERPMKDVAKSVIYTEAVSANETKVTWGFYGQMKYPMNLMMGMMKNMLGKDLTGSLANLKQLLEQ